MTFGRIARVLALGGGVSVCAGGIAAAPLADHILWSIGHEGCRVYAPGAERTAFLPLYDARKCFLRVQSHNRVATLLIAGASDPALLAATKVAVRDGLERYRVRENFEWVAQHEGLLGTFRSLARERDFETIRRRYAHAQSHNPDALNALSLISDVELRGLIEEPRVAITLGFPTAEKLKAIAAVTRPSITTLATDATLFDVARSAYGSTERAYLDTLVSSNPQFNAAMVGDGITALKRGTRVRVPSLPLPNGVVALTLRDGLDVTMAFSQISAVPDARSEVVEMCNIEEPVAATLQQSTLDRFKKGDAARWYVEAVGASKIRAEDLAFTESTAVVGVIDAGVDLAHSSIKPVLWRLPPELGTQRWPGGSHGYDFFRNKPEPVEEDLGSHGTHVTGIATGRQLAMWIPALDEKGLARSVAAFSLKIAGEKGPFDFTRAQNAIIAAVSQNIEILNLSLTAPPSDMLRRYLSTPEVLNNTLLVISAGNQGLNLDEQALVHASFRDTNGKPLENVIFVAALTDEGTLAPLSNHGPLSVQIAAPGVEVSSTVRGSTFGTKSGTSMAAPSVTLAAAMLRSIKPGLSMRGVKNRILGTCDFDSRLALGVANGCRLNLLKTIARNSDLVELKESGDILRGDLETSQFQFTQNANGGVVRIWMDGPTQARVVYADGLKRTESLRIDKIAVRLHGSQPCPGATESGVCTIDVSSIRDVVLRIPR